MGFLDANSSAEIAGITTVQDTTQASSTSTGALIVSGGASVAKNLFVGGGAEVTGVTTITGTLDANGDLDVDGHTDLDFVIVSAASTFSQMFLLELVQPLDLVALHTSEIMQSNLW